MKLLSREGHGLRHKEKSAALSFCLLLLVATLFATVAHAAAPSGHGVKPVGASSVYFRFFSDHGSALSEKISTVTRKERPLNPVSRHTPRGYKSGPRGAAENTAKSFSGGAGVGDRHIFACLQDRAQAACEQFFNGWKLQIPVKARKWQLLSTRSGRDWGL